MQVHRLKLRPDGRFVVPRLVAPPPSPPPQTTTPKKRAIIRPSFRFGQAYITTGYPGAVKAWHYHKKQTDSFACIQGMMKVVLYDSRENSSTRGLINEFFVGVHNPMLIQIPPLVMHGFKCISESEAVVVNLPTEVYVYNEPDEFRLPAHSKEIPYDWARKDG